MLAPFFHQPTEERYMMLALLLALRVINALTSRTFFQPDEYYQSLEPAWQLAFGDAGNAWITWEWRSQLRSFLHPAIFAAIYLATAKLAGLLGLSLQVRAELLVAAPKITQAAFATLLDFYSWRLAEKIYGRGSRAALTTLALSVCSPWQWFCATRTLSNCLETTITLVAVYYWPWSWPASAARDDPKTQEMKDPEVLESLSQLRLSLLLAAFACILRPTNVLVWLAISTPTLWQASTLQRYVLVREILICGSAVLAFSVLSDRGYYRVWTLPPLRFLYFNIVQSLAVFYGRNRPDYYLTEGLPLLLTTALPFTIVGLWHALRASSQDSSASFVRDATAQSTDASAKASSSPRPVVPDAPVVPQRILSRLAWTSFAMVLTLSLISHKEVRFLYPILPFLHVVSAGPLASFFLTASSTHSSPTLHPSLPRRTLLVFLLLVNVLIAGYGSQIYQRGVIDVLSYLRTEHEARLNSDAQGQAITTVGFLMPCHSTPWRSHMVHPGINAWALTCEPPLHIPLSDRSSYLDEADQFYLDPGPQQWLAMHMDDKSSVTSSGSRSSRHWAKLDPANQVEGRKPWPQYLVFFEQLEEQMREYLGDTRYRECWRGFNSHVHDDWRRIGDVVVWCLG